MRSAETACFSHMMVFLLSASSHAFGTSAARSFHPRVGFSVPLRGSFNFSSFSGSSPFPRLFAASSTFLFPRVSRPLSSSPPCSSLAPHSSLLFCSACAGSSSRVSVCGSGVSPLSFRFFSTNHPSSFPSTRQACIPAATHAGVSSVGAPLQSTASCRVAACSVPRPFFSSISSTSSRSGRPFESPTFLSSIYGASGEARLFSGRPTTPNCEPADATYPSKQKLANSPCVVWSSKSLLSPVSTRQRTLLPRQPPVLPAPPRFPRFACPERANQLCNPEIFQFLPRLCRRIPPGRAVLSVALPLCRAPPQVRKNLPLSSASSSTSTVCLRVS
uniref:Putative transmembrane protein n=1 Tax=Toxoplasma gondii COUG TaxID=1074873 RepID=A0A2G8XTP6_TOXGO|nr:putative transmembrane protein [Toxoplasma gondii COUG]